MEVVILPAKENLIGKKFGRLTVIESLPSENRRTYWLCQCNCGKKCKARADSLKSGKTKSCGCLNKEQQIQLGKNNKQDITGQKFGKLKAIKNLNYRLNSSLGYQWECQCDCGNIITVPITYLKSGNTKSCGCQKESLGEELIKDILIKENIIFEREKIFNNLKKLRFDFYIPSLNIIIEFDGLQHYKITNFTTSTLLEHDKIKNEWCLKNNIKLFRIPYSELSNLKNYNFNDLINDKWKVTTINHYNIKIPRCKSLGIFCLCERS